MENPNKLLKEDNTPQDKEEEQPIQDEEEEGGIELEEDVYSLMFLEGFGPVLFFSLFIVGMQLLIILLFYWDLLRDGEDDNALSIPINVDTQVTIAQFVALPLAVMSHEDCTTALYQLSAKYDPKILETHPSATRSYWLATLALRFTVGFLLIFISFIQIMQSERITDLFLNLEAIVLVGNIDNFAFWLAQKGFLRKDFQEAAEKVGDVTLPQAGKEMRCNKQISRTWIRRVVMLLTWVILIVGWIIISTRQWVGIYLFGAACQSFTVQFGDDVLSLQKNKIVTDETIRFYFYNNTDTSEVDFLYSYFSGTYKLLEYDDGRHEVVNKRGVYYEFVNASDTTQADKGQFYFCEGEDGDEGSWIFTIDAFRDAFEREGDEDDCVKGWLMRSPPTDAFTLEEVPTEGWRVWTGSSKGGTVSAASNFDIVCNDCETAIDCSYHGTCNEDTKVCECEPDYLGSRCEIDPPCTDLELDIAGSYFGIEEVPVYTYGPFKLVKKDRTFASSGMVTPSQDLLLAYGKPVYALSFNEMKTGSLEEDAGDPYDLWGILFNTGSRWYYTEWYFSELGPTFFEQYYPLHAFWDQVFDGKTLFFSEETTSGTPVGITWNEKGSTSSIGDYGHFGAGTTSVPISFHCLTPSCVGLPENYCGLLGECVEGSCTCDDGIVGRFCQYFLTAEFTGDDASSSPLTGGPTVSSTFSPTEGLTVSPTSPPTAGPTVSPTSPLTFESTGESTNNGTNNVTNNEFN